MDQFLVFGTEDKGHYYTTLWPETWTGESQSPKNKDLTPTTGSKVYRESLQ